MNFPSCQICLCFRVLLSLAAFLFALAGLGVTLSQKSQAQTAAPVQPPSLPDAWSFYGDSLAAVRKGLLFKPEQKTPQFSLTIPLIVDRKQNRILVVASINGRKVRLIVDTGGGSGVTLTKSDAEGIVLENAFPVRLHGFQGYEPATEGIIPSMTFSSALFSAADTVVMNNSAVPSTLSTQAFERYRVTLDFMADTMTLGQGGESAVAGKGEESVSVPFHDDNGAIFVPVHVAGYPTWAAVDSGGDLSHLSMTIGNSVAPQLPAEKSFRTAVNASGGIGTTRTGTHVLLFAYPVPISIDVMGKAVVYTTAQIALSDIDDELNPVRDRHTDVNLGEPFFLQFHRVIIDYPNRMLILQGARHGVLHNLVPSAPYPGKPWPGYRWQRSGDGYIEVPAQSVPKTRSTP